jgi:hypothetical protein
MQCYFVRICGGLVEYLESKQVIESPNPANCQWFGIGSYAVESEDNATTGSYREIPSVGLLADA